MKKAVRISFYSLALLAVIFFSLPYAINLEPVQTELKNRLCARLDIRADVDRMAWEWFPSPRLSLFRVSLFHQRFDASFPYGAICPDIVGLIKWRTAVKLILERPDIVVNSLCQPGVQKGQCEADTTPPLTSVVLVIKNGHLVLPSDGILERFASLTPRSEISGFDAEAALFQNGFDIKSTFDLPFVKKVTSHIRVKKKRQKKTGTLKDYWHLDISGKDLDLTRAREKVLLLFGDHGVTRKVCDIVRGGRVEKGRYIFNGYAEDFKDLGAMKIRARADNVDILVPKIGLPLEHGTGPVVIEAGILTGHSLSARLGNSIGENGSVRLDLLGRDHAFKLDVDVDVEVEELRGWLINNLLSRHETVINELRKVTRAQGRASGHLHIGDTLHTPVVKADVFASDSLVEYPLFDNPVQFKHGGITIYHDKLSWEQVGGQIGPQYIDDSRGTVSWKDDLRIDVDKIDARLEAGPLLKEIALRLAMKDRLAPLIDDVDGPLEIKNMKIHGPLNDIKKLEYDCTVSTDGLTVDGSLLPDKVRIHSSGARISNDRVVLPPSQIDMSGRQLMLETDLSHNLWRDFSGSLTINGVIGKKTAQWVKKKNLIPPRFFPNVPCFVDPLTVSWNKNEISLKGKIIPGRNEDSGVTSRLDLTLSEDRLDLKALSVSSMDETADMWFYLDRGQQPCLKAGFTGSLKKETLDVLLENNQFLTGTISGDCELEYHFDHSAPHRLTGDLDVSWAVLFFKDNRIVIDSAAVAGDESSVKIKRADLKLNDESVIVDGRIYFPDESDIKTELNVTSRSLSARNLKKLFGDLKNIYVNADHQQQSPPATSGPTSRPGPDGFSATGIINVDVKQFQYNPERAAAAAPVKQFVGDDLSGTITLQQGNRISVSLFSGSVCDLQVAGIVGLPPEKTALTFHTMAGSRPKVQELLDCLGITDREFSGKYVLDAAINGTPGNWTDGYIEFKARKGRMKGLAVISKILTLLNVTELFSINVFKNFFTIGYPYSDMKVSGKIKDNILTIDETQIIGEGLDLFFKGTVDLNTTALDMSAYVKPFKMVDSIITLIPYVGKNLGDGEKSIAFIPFKIKGTIGNPDVFLIFEDKNRPVSQ